ncbi:MAG: hypothetical protein ABI432_19400 [Flavobacteriales bacterium]
MKHVALFGLALGTAFNASSQALPWERPLMIAGSVDGITFDTPEVFQDSAGVPSVVRWKGDTLIATFQWFRQPNPSPSWDRVAVKFSFDNGTNWTGPTPIVVNGIPTSYQRPFDPTLTAIGGDSLRIYFSSSDGIPPPTLDSTVNTYSAVSTDGIHYTFEPGPRVDVLDNRVIDPAVIHFGPGWHYLAPAGAPQDGAYHYLSADGITFTPVPMIPSDGQHNWTGNYMVDGPTEVRFYGAGQNGVWYNSSPNGGMWNGYVNTNIMGGDPSVLKVGEGNYLMVYVGQPYAMGIGDDMSAPQVSVVAPIPAHDRLCIAGERPVAYYRILSSGGVLIQEGRPANGIIRLDQVAAGCHLLELIEADGTRNTLRFVKE